ncbi:GNAT family N-acetyltransferase [Agrococcus carbonis]|uniref:N-acetyltransferase domain-containing protein n=1 Tax=Agrococcus carbonis TaxID=684552 RepID=A0A1H1L153_9MICO|nr:hypothetical protein [Agrococcus carbonis]SDR67992.1 hypothetical protein SAMN04489719_0337 [Agrococcus carbonis]
MEVVEVADEAGLDEFLRLGRETHGGRAVPVLERTVRAWHRGTTPHPHPVTLLLARTGAHPVGRAIVHRDDRLDARLGSRALVFGALEARDAAVLDALLDDIERRALAAGATEVFGPAQLLPNQSGGVITAGFEERGFLDAAWNPEWVPEVLEARGMERWYEGDTWVVDVVDEDGPSVAELDAAGIRIDEVTRAGLGRGLRALLPLLNDSFAQLPYFTPFTAAELHAQFSGFWLLHEPGLFLIARDEEDVPLAFVLAVLDAAPMLQASGGRFGPRERWRLLAHRRELRSDAVLVIQGARPEAQGKGIVTLLSRRLHANLADIGCRRLRSTPVGRQNPGSARQFSRFGGRPLHATAYYRKSLTR